MNKDTTSDLNRRDFLRGSSLATLMMMMGGVPLRAAENAAEDGATDYTGEAQPLPVGVVGCGVWGREILGTLSTIPFGPVAAVCDNYAPSLRRAGRLAPDAKAYADYRELLADAAVKGVIVATPSHLHKAVVLEALKAGKHVYCEAPLAHTVEDARAIARAARDATSLYFQTGLQNRSDKQITHLYTERIRAGILGKVIKARSQHHRKTSWRIASPTPEREIEANWRLAAATSPGLVGELGIHQIDVASWFFMKRPVAVSGFGSLIQWRDGRDVPDSVQALIEYPEGLFLNYESTIANSFNAEMETFYGADCAILMRDRRAWMFKEADAPLLGWEVYARKDSFYNESGIILGAGGTTQEAQDESADGVVDEKSALRYGLEAFLINAYNHGASVADFVSMFGEDDPDALKEYLADTARSRLAAAGFQEGYEATITALLANQAIQQNRRIELPPSLFDLG